MMRLMMMLMITIIAIWGTILPFLYTEVATHDDVVDDDDDDDDEYKGITLGSGNMLPDL